MTHLPHSPLPYYAAAVTLYALIVAVAVLARIWRRKRHAAVPSRYLQPPGVPTSGQILKAQTISLQFSFSMANINKAMRTTAVQMAHLGSVIRRMNPPDDLAQDPPTWKFPTWRVTARPFDWRID